MGVREPGIAIISHLRGRSALTPFRAQRLHHSLSRELPGFSSITAEYLYFVELRDALTDDQERLLAALLDARPTSTDLSGNECHGFVVIPRPGTISPWSSKATDIVHNCGLHGISRVERGVEWQVQMTAGEHAATLLETVVAPRVHDRMTQAVIPGLDSVHALFDRAARRPLQSIEVIAKGRTALEQSSDAGRLYREIASQVDASVEREDDEFVELDEHVGRHGEAGVG